MAKASMVGTNPSSLARRGSVFASFAAVLLLGTWASAQRSERARVTLEYDVATGATGCPSREAFVDAVASRLGYDPFVPAAKETVNVSVSPEKHGFTGTVRMGGARTVRSSDCHELVDSLAVAVALGIDPDAALRPPPSASASASTPPPVPPSALPAPPPRPSASVAPRPVAPPPEPPAEGFERSARVALGVVGALGDTPSPTGGLALGLDLHLAPRFAIEAEISGVLPSSVRIGTGGRGLASGSLVEGLLGLCVPVAPLSFCATGAAGALSLSADNVDVARPETAAYAALGLRASLRIPITARFFLRFQLDGQAPLTRFDVRIDGASLWETSPVVGRGGLAFGARFL